MSSIRTTNVIRAIGIPVGVLLAGALVLQSSHAAFTASTSTPTAKLSIYGSLIVEGDFESTVRQAIEWNKDDGWAITYEASTPSWASWSGKKGSRVLYVRAIRMCDGGIYGAFELEYSEADLRAYDPVVDRLVGSLSDSGTGWQC